jgi:hypothetical protein
MISIGYADMSASQKPGAMDVSALSQSLAPSVAPMLQGDRARLDVMRLR